MPNKYGITVIAMLWLSMPGFSEEPPAEQTETTESSPVAQSGEVEEEQEFDPTEEIVEDYSVPFPVDI